MGPPPLPFDPIAEARRQWTVRWGEEPSSSMAVVTSIMRCQQILLGALNEMLRPLHLTFARYEVLMLLSFSREGRLPLGKIGERLQVHRTSVTGLIDRLEEQGLVVRVAHETDRRTTLAEITPAGRALAEKATELLNAADFTVPAMAREDLERLNALLGEIRRAAGDFDS
jgi:DNA-binding MarR family transcriptional regulator